MPVGLTTLSNRLAPSVSPGCSSWKKKYNGRPAYVTSCTDWPETTSVRVTVPRRLRLTPRPAIGAPSVRSAGHKSLAHVAPPSAEIGVAGHAKTAPECAKRGSDV